jgi:hypothetical protein
MNEELEKMVAQMMAEGAPQSEIDAVIQVYLNEYSPVEEKKNPIQNGGDSNVEGISSESPTFNTKGERLYEFSGKMVTKDYLEGFGLPVPQDVDPTEGKQKVTNGIKQNEYTKALGSGITFLAKGVMGLPANLSEMSWSARNAYTRLTLEGTELDDFEETIAKVQGLPDKERTQAILELDSDKSLGKKLFGIDISPITKASDKVSRAMSEEQEKVNATRNQYESNIIDDIGQLKLGQASERIATGIIESLPMMALTLTGMGGLAVMGAATTSNKMDELEANGEDVDMKMTGISVARGAAEILGGKVLQGIFKPVLGKLAPEAAAEVSKSITKRISQAFGKEFLEEGLQSVQEEVTEILAYSDNIDDVNWVGVFKNFIDSGLIGGFSAAPAGVVTPRVKQENQTAIEGTPTELNIPAVEGGIPAPPAAPLAQPEATEPTLLMNKTKAGRYNDEVSGNVISKNQKGEWVVKTKSGKVLHKANTLKAASAFQEQTNLETQLEAKRTPEQKASNLIQKGQESGKSESEILEEIEDESVRRTAKIQLEEARDAALLTPQEAAKKAKESAQKARDEQARNEEKFIGSAEAALQRQMDRFSDRQASVKRTIRKAGIGKKIEALIVSKLGANAQANRIYQKVESLVFKGIDSEMTRMLEVVIQQKRILSLDKNRKDRGYSRLEHQDGQNSERAKLALDGLKEELGEKAFNDLNKRADAFFNQYRGLLKSMKDEGIISEQTYLEFAEVDYQPRKVIKFMTDMEGQFMPEKLDQFESSSLAQAPIQSSTTGSTESQVMDSRGLIQKSILGRTKAIFANRLNKAFAAEFGKAMIDLQVIQNKEAQGEALTVEEIKRKPYLQELSRLVKEDKVARYTESGNPVYENEGKADGYKSLYYYIGGVQGRLLLREDFYSKFTDTGNQVLSAAAREGISVATGTRMVKYLATGNNPLFFITNVPRDLAFVLTFSEAYGTNNLNILQNNIVVQGLKLGKDFLKGYYSSIARNELYDKYFEYGGGMDFLTIQGRYGKGNGVFGKRFTQNMNDAFFDLQNTLPAKAINGTMDAIGKANTASEIATRLAIFDRTIKKALREKGVDKITELEKEEQEDIYVAAVQAAREITDFNQGGTVTKAWDAGIPYLNAATQGTRAAVKNTQERPAETTWRLFQMAGIMGSAMVYGAVMMVGFFRDEEEEDLTVSELSDDEIYFETLKGISEYDLKNYFVFPTGTKNEKGDWEYWRMAKAQSLSPFLGISEHIMRAQISESAGIEYEQEDWVRKTFNTIDENLLPVSVNPLNTFGRIPAVDALVATMGIDGYTGNVLDWDRGKIPEQLEGRYNSNVEEFYKDIGNTMDWSPVRMKSAVESFITTPSTNPYVGLGYAAGELIAADQKADILKTFGSAAMRRMKKSTSEYNATAKLLDNINPATVEAYTRHLDTKDAVKKAVIEAKQTGNEGKLEEILLDILKEKPDLAENAVKWAKTEIEKQDFIPIINEMRFTTNKEVRAIIIAKVFGDALFETDENKLTPREKKILKQLGEANVFDAEVAKYYKEIIERK